MVLSELHNDSTTVKVCGQYARARRGQLRGKWAPLPSREAWPVVWVYSGLLALRQEQRRRERIVQVTEALNALNAKLCGPRPRRRKHGEVVQRVEEILAESHAKSYFTLELFQGEQHTYRQAARGRPGPHTRYVRKTRKFWQVRFSLDEAAIHYERKSDGMYPLLSNDHSLTNAQIFEAHKRQPTIEKRFEQTKTVFEIAPVLLKKRTPPLPPRWERLARLRVRPPGRTAWSDRGASDLALTCGFYVAIDGSLKPQAGREPVEVFTHTGRDRLQTVNASSRPACSRPSRRAAHLSAENEVGISS